ncbi:MAG: phytanoyl-CoA dioxygenase family protein [Herminiimonas sp.]|nr:phytanoyl-CoA dioxygenase family protein [Herminiimonas sp.]
MDAALSTAQIDQFEVQGYLVLRTMVTPATCEQMLAVAAHHSTEAIAPIEYEVDVGYPGAPASPHALGGRTIRRLRGAYERHTCFREWASDPIMAARLKQLFNEDICLTLAHHNCIMTKHPDYGTATGWHRDIRYWSFKRPDLICTWLALGHENGMNGGLKFIPGSHRMHIMPAQLDTLDFLRPDVVENQALFDQGLQLELQSGDVVLFHSGLFHAAGRNASNVIKTSVVFAYHAASNGPIPGTKSAISRTVAI